MGTNMDGSDQHIFGGGGVGVLAFRIASYHERGDEVTLELCQWGSAWK